jgi:site-specific recombinase XerD
VLTIFRRHLQSCRNERGIKPRNYRKCSCPLHVEGSLGGEPIRRALDLTSWEAAEDLVARWRESGRIGVSRKVIPSLKEAIGKHIADAEARNLRAESIKKIRDVIERRFLAFCDKRGVSLLRQVDVDCLREFRNQLTDEYSPNSARKRIEYVRAFFRFCHQSGWVETNPAHVVKPPLADDKGVETFTEEEVDRMLATADSFNTRGKFGAGNRRRIRAMILLLRYSGLRISDAAVLARDRLAGDKLSVRTVKTGTEVWCPLPNKAAAALSASPSDNSKYFFWNGACRPTSTVKVWECTFQRVFELAKIPRHKAFIHNFRHSFATDLLTRGIPIEDVAILLGNSVKIVEKHYAHLVKARRERLEQRVRKLWSAELAGPR